MSRTARRYRRKHGKSSTSLISNPPLFTDIVMFVGPGFGGYAASRVATKVVSRIAGKLNKPALSKHLGALASVGAFVGAWLLAHKWKPIAKYHTPVVVGSGIAMLHTLAQTYLPGIAVMMDPLAGNAGRSPVSLPAPSAQGAITPDGNEYFTYNDMFDAGVYANEVAPPSEVPGSPAQQAESAEGEDTLSDLMAELGADGMDLGGDTGIFSN
jgi:hypothetical protein